MARPGRRRPHEAPSGHAWVWNGHNHVLVEQRLPEVSVRVVPSVQQPKRFIKPRFVDESSKAFE